MRAFRLASLEYEPLSGGGAARYGGRWNSPGRRVAYTSAHLSLAVLETLVHVDGLDQMPVGRHYFEFELSDTQVESISVADLPEAWRREPELTRVVGDRWLDERRSVGLRVPSAVVVIENNLLINPEHPAFEASLDEIHSAPFSFDSRLAG